MLAVVLAAGVGSRLRPLTDVKPKCLVEVAGRPILGHQADAYLAAGIEGVVVVGGYQIEQLRSYCKQRYGSQVTVVDNVDFDVTNNMYSLYLSREHIVGSSIILSNGDVVLEPSIIASMVRDARPNLVAVERGVWIEESMKVQRDAGGWISSISKAITRNDAYGTSTDVYRFSAETVDVLIRELNRVIRVEGDRTQWTEVALDRLMQRHAIDMHPFDIGLRKWVEIDSLNDLASADRLFAALPADLDDKKLLFIDLDGTVLLGDSAIPGAAEFIERIRSRGMPFYFLSNNSSRSKDDYVRKLAHLNIQAKKEEILLSTDGLIAYLLEKGVEGVYLVGTASMAEMLREAGIDTAAVNPHYVVLGYDTELTYAKLATAALLLQNGAKLLATHPDLVCPTPEGNLPDIGSLLALLQTATGILPEKVFGKPSPDMLLATIEQHGLNPGDAVVIGDRLYTDIRMARDTGCASILVLSGETCRLDLEGAEQYPTLVVTSVKELG